MSFARRTTAQAVVCADGTQLVLATKLVTTTADAPSFAAVILGMKDTVGLPKTVLADTGYASAAAVEALEAAWVEPLVAIGRTQPHRRYDFRPPPPAKPSRWIKEPWRLAMKAKLKSDDGKARYKMRKQTVEPVFGIPKCSRLHTLPPPRLGQRSNRVEPRYPSLQLQAHHPNAGRLR